MVPQPGGRRRAGCGCGAGEFYTGGAITSGDFDLVGAREEIVGEALVEVGFRRVQARGLGGFDHPESLIAVEFATGPLFAGRTDVNRLRLVMLDDAGDAKVLFPPRA
jgi:hypothetical protein